ncbi:MAG: hypothetical protein NT062_36645, partial [Proteobacteria bacterium]|nr:hypothetical protein [Pseudomonadota bacterium]
MRVDVAAFASIVALLAACALPAKVPSLVVARGDDRITIVAAERGPSGVRLVAVDEHGDRRFALIAPPASAVLVRDTHPAVSPDGRWVVFASNRDRADGGTNLWLAPLGVETIATRVLGAENTLAIDAHPAWSRDGRFLVFSSTRARGDFDL